jgi:hypothetical protein
MTDRQEVSLYGFMWIVVLLAIFLIDPEIKTPPTGAGYPHNLKGPRPSENVK